VADARAAEPIEARLQRLSEELRCLVCQNQTLADSQAPLAIELKSQVREQLQRGATDQQAKDYLVQRYGDFVLYRSPLKAATALLWAGPGLMLAGGLAVLGLRLRRQRRAPEEEAQA